MSIFTEQQRREIEEIVARNQPIQTRAFDNINPKKLNNAKAAFGNSIKPDEEIFFQYDDTVFGSAREGILMTSLGMHSKGQSHGQRFTPYEDIRSIGETLRGAFTINLKDSHTIKLDAHHDTKKISALAGELVHYMQKNFLNQISAQTQGSSPAKVDHRCAGCGAPNHSGQSFCEYCGNPLAR